MQVTLEEARQEILENAIAEERRANDCDHKMIVDENGGYLECGPSCVGCHNYDSIECRCELRENIIQALNEDAWG